MARLSKIACVLGVATAAAIGVAGGSPVAAARAPVTHTVRFGEYFFRPARLVIHVGDRVRFVNVGRIQHTVADTDARWNIRSRIIHPRPLSHGQSQTVRFTHRGVVHYLCTFHPTLMRGVIVVR
jgi:plastocyanin